jgi:hypothetical protein
VIALILAAIAVVLAGPPAALFFWNLRFYLPPPATPGGGAPAVSVLIPARDEERSICAAVGAALASRDVTLEVVVLDDHSADRTAALVREMAARDDRVRLVSAPELPAGWCGKQHACHLLAQAARHSLLCFIDADVRLRPEGLARLCAFREACGADLVSGIPWQETGTWMERLLIPLIHFVLLGFLPLARMRESLHPAYAAGCGQLFLARKETYDAVGGHAVIRATLHDGIALPRAFRRAGKKTDLCDATDLATCRMYRGAGEVWRGLAKNATEGLASPWMIGPATLVLLGGQVLPAVLLAWGDRLAWVALALAYAPRLAGVVRFRQSLGGALLHPVGVWLLIAIQWYALARSLLRRPSAWKGRQYQPA